MTVTRTETDTFGPLEVDASRYWGAQTQRSLGNFKIGWEKQPQPVVRALGLVKRAAAEVNMSLGRLDRTSSRRPRRSWTALWTTTSPWRSGRPDRAPSRT
jgi:fumarate hydratase class II